MKRILMLTALLTAAMLLCTGCSNYQYDYREDVLEYAMIAQPGDLSKLDEYPNLTYVDLRGSTCYDEILAYAKANPQVTVRYNVQIGQKRFNQDTDHITLYGYEADCESLIENLKYLPNVSSIHINQITMRAEELSALTAAYPDVAFTYSVEISGQNYDHTVTEMDLARLNAAEIPQAIRSMQLLPLLTDVKLADESGLSKLELSDVKQLVDAMPQVNFLYHFKLFDQRISLTDKELVFDSVKIGNDGVEKIRAALDVMTKCTYVKLDSCGIDDAVMAQLRADYPEKNVVWRVFAGKYSILTDEEMLRMNYSLDDQDAKSLIYCNNIKYLDMTSSKITNIDFAQYMPRLECVILTLTKVTDLSPLTNCPNLTWLELSSCTGLKDLSPLASLQNLKYLCVSKTKVSDLTALDNVALERFNCVKSAVKSDALESFIAKHPDCVTTSRGSALGYGWRYEDKDQKTPFPYYAELRKIFRYDDKKFNGNRK